MEKPVLTAEQKLAVRDLQLKELYLINARTTVQIEMGRLLSELQVEGFNLNTETLEYN